MNEHGKKWREEFEEFYSASAFNYEENPIGSRECGLQWASYLAARRQDAARIAEFQREMCKWVERFKGEHALVQVAEIAELRAELDALEKQEPVWMFDYHPYRGLSESLTGFPLYAKPVTATPAIPFGYWHQGETREESDFFLAGESGDVSCDNCVKLYAKPVTATPAIPEGWQLVPKEPFDKACVLVREMEAEIAHLKHQHKNDAAANQLLSDACDRLNARVDALMLMYCPDEMSPVQIAEWAKNQPAPVEPEEVYSPNTIVVV